MPDGLNKLDGDEGVDTAIASFMAQWSKDPADAQETPSEDAAKKKALTPAEGEESEPSKTEDTPEEEPSEEDEQAEDEESERKFGDDETYVKITVGEEEHEVPVKDLKRLWGQEAALTRKSQEVADARKAADADQAKAITATNVLLQRATERANQYRQLDFLSLAKEFTAEEFNTLRAQAQAAIEEETFLKQELGGFMQAVQEQQAKAAQTEAAECIKQLTDPASNLYIEGWNQQLYNDLRTFAVDQGLPKEVINNVRIPGVFKLLHMAMQYQAGKTALTKTVKVKNKPPKRIVKTSKAPKITSGSNDKVAAAMAKLKITGSTDDAMEAFLARAESIT